MNNKTGRHLESWVGVFISILKALNAVDGYTIESRQEINPRMSTMHDATQDCMVPRNPADTRLLKKHIQVSTNVQIHVTYMGPWGSIETNDDSCSKT